MVSTVLANVSMSSLNQAGTQDKMSTKVLRPLFQSTGKGAEFVRDEKRFPLMVAGNITKTYFL